MIFKRCILIVCIAQNCTINVYEYYNVQFNTPVLTGSLMSEGLVYPAT